MSAALITELQELLKVGVNVDKYQLHLTVKLVAVICDAPDRSNVKYIVGHNGIAGCDRCQVLGRRMSGRMTFPDGEHELRSDVTFRSRSQYIHHRGRSLFENPPVDMINCSPSEPMHMIYLGVTKKLISLWKELAIKRLNRMDQLTIASINEALDICRQHTTCDFQRKCRPLYEVSVWKATECRWFLLYLGPVILHNRLPLSMYRNFQSLSLSMYLLSHPKFHSTFANSVRVYINNFLLGYERCYGTEHLIYNVHSLKHIADDVMEHGGKYILVDDKEKQQVLCIPNKWLLTNDHYLYRDDISEHEIVEGIDVDSRFNVGKCAVMHRCDDYNVAQELKVCLATVLRYNTNITTNDETQSCHADKPKSSSSKADVSLPPLPRTLTEVNKPLCDDTNQMLRIILKAVTGLSSKVDKVIAVCERLAMGAKDRRMKEKYSDGITFPLRTHDELRSLEAALENQKFRDHFVSCNRCLKKF
ncbi:unnamed protein product [Schistosoma curassoni]|uniref:Helitron_like_N domain-containing protein n=1 Tax=Schistosoma curassoni TaxID=6186 RepID=A0A183K1H5_9TREM|nr:unnamed protein product [Schistosoma curassoni]